MTLDPHPLTLTTDITITASAFVVGATRFSPFVGLNGLLHVKAFTSAPCVWQVFVRLMVTAASEAASESNGTSWVATGWAFCTAAAFNFEPEF